MLGVKMIGLGATVLGAVICFVIGSLGSRLGRRWQAAWSIVVCALAVRFLGDVVAVSIGSTKKPPSPGVLLSLRDLWSTGYPFALQSILLCIGLAWVAFIYWQNYRSGAASPEAREIARLQHDLARRTHQISTLHAITADLNNTLDIGQVLNTALERMADAVRANGGAVWVRLDAPGLSAAISAVAENSPARPQAPTSLAEANPSLGADSEDSLAARIKADAARLNAASTTSRTLNAPGATPQPAGSATPMVAGWRQVYTRATTPPECAQVLQDMYGALEAGGLAYCSQFCRTRGGTAHVVPIQWKGEELGALGLVRLESALEADERQLLDAIVLEVGAALQNAQLYQDAIRLADRDSLTDLLNHRVIQQQLSINLSRTRRTSSEMAVIMMDLKNFKFFNDTYGHKVGDFVLQTVASCLREACRVTDILGRYGGDEFMALLPDTDFEGAQHVCSRIAAAVLKEGYQQANDGRRIPIALSFGAALYPADGDSALELLSVAQANLEEAKSTNEPLLVQRAPAEEAEELRKLKDASVGGAFGVLDALVTAIDNKDHYTRRHSEDVTHWATLMSRHLGHEPEIQRAVRICGLLHDVGKIAVPDAVLRKPGRLNDDEFQIMQQHPVFGALIVKDVPNLEEVLGGIRHHHERYDGKGYPDKLKAHDIPMMGRLLAVPDCFSAMTTERPYRKALSWQDAIDEIQRGQGTQFDPAMAAAFLAVIEEIRKEKALIAPPDPVLSPEETMDTTSSAEATRPVVRPRSVTDAESIVAK